MCVLFMLLFCLPGEQLFLLPWKTCIRLLFVVCGGAPTSAWCRDDYHVALGAESPYTQVTMLTKDDIEQLAKLFESRLQAEREETRKLIRRK